MFVEERRRGIYDMDAHTPSTITSHAPGYQPAPVKSRGKAQFVSPAVDVS
jgi:hypothetical protein